MRTLLARITSFPWHPLALGIYPVMALYARNVRQTEMVVVFRSLVIAFAFSCALMLLFRMILFDWHRAAFCTAVLVLLFFSYGHVYNYVEDVSPFGVLLGRHRFLVIIWAGLALLAVTVSFRKSMNIARYTAILNTIAIVLLLFPLATVILYRFSVRDVPSVRVDPVSALTVMTDQALPDVYYIILDSYTRSDVLKEVYGYDNSAFLNELEKIGFYVAECSTSNYMWTQLSISSTLNMEYLQDDPGFADAADKDVFTEDLLKHSLVRRTFESLGYKTVAFATGFPFNEITDSDIYLEPPISMRGAREFEVLLVNTTLLRVLQDFGYIRINQAASANSRDRTLFALSEFDNLPEMGGPKFAYIHIITPHPPFVFGPNGESIDPGGFKSLEGQYTDETYFQGYVGQVRFISDQMIRSVRKLLDGSPTPPIIIIQGDHGPWKQQGQNRVSILNAYYLPGHPGAVYPAISPVNSFRVVFNEYFHAEYPLLDDFSYRSPYANVYDFKLQPTLCGGGK